MTRKLTSSRSTYVAAAGRNAPGKQKFERFGADDLDIIAERLKWGLPCTREQRRALAGAQRKR